MNHLVVTVSPESSVDLLSKHADIILLDQVNVTKVLSIYKSIYVRSHFSKAELQPQNFQDTITAIVSRAKSLNPNIHVVDGMDTVEKIIGFEDKWNQYQIYSEFMPQTEVLNTLNDSNDQEFIYKKRLSSRGLGVTADLSEVTGPENEWIVQEKLDIDEEIRVYVIRGKVYPKGAVRRSMAANQMTQSISVRELTNDEIAFASAVGQRSNALNMIGLDVARTSDGTLQLMEANRSPGFGAFAELTQVNLADVLYADE